MKNTGGKPCGNGAESGVMQPQTKGHQGLLGSYGEARKESSLELPEGMVPQGIPEFLIQQHVLPFPLSSGSVYPTPSGTVSSLSLRPVEACYLLLLNFDILKRGFDLNLRVLDCVLLLIHVCM